MAIADDVATAMEGIKERVTPALDRLDETTRQARRAMVRGQHAAEDAAAAAAAGIRRRPVSAVVIAAGAGALAGCLIGFGFSRMARCGR